MGYASRHLNSFILNLNHKTHIKFVSCLQILSLHHGRQEQNTGKLGTEGPKLGGQEGNHLRT